MNHLELDLEARTLHATLTGYLSTEVSEVIFWDRQEDLPVPEGLQVEEHEDFVEVTYQGSRIYRAVGYVGRAIERAGKTIDEPIKTSRRRDAKSRGGRR